MLTSGLIIYIEEYAVTLADGGVSYFPAGVMKPGPVEASG